MGIIFYVAIAITFGFIAGKLLSYLKMPGVVGYLLAGLVFGPSFLNVFNLPILHSLIDIITALALSLVAFTIGSEMRVGTFKQMGKGIGIIILLESLGAFLFVAAGVYFLTQKLYLALIFGALAPASAPAGTVAVLQECKAKGRLTNALYAVVGLDDGFAILIFAFAIALAKLIFTGETISFTEVLEGPAFEIFGSIALGAAVAFIAGYFLRRIRQEDSVLAVSLGHILICTGIANYLGFSLILANLSLGMVFVNFFSASSRKVSRAIQSVLLPIYIIFFFIAGASLQIKLLPSMGILGLVYILCRTSGLIGGSFLGALLSKQDSVIRKYLGLGILSQAGVAIGLAVLAARVFDPLGEMGKNLAITIVNIIAATTIVFEIIGPIGAKFAISKAGEIGLNITEEDLIQTYSVGDVMDTKVPAIAAGLSLSEVIRIVSSTNSFYYPVIDNDKKLIGAATLDGIRNTFATQELHDWLVALDIVEPIIEVVTPDIALSEAFDKAKQLDIEHIPVVETLEGKRFVGVLNCRAARRSLSTEVLYRQQKANSYAQTIAKS
ncbi:MAG: cation:proton antiporter [Sedimentisphaerales bacterium]|nr:cation:proton antiporter [Sedimentisphaerales bacterium]